MKRTRRVLSGARNALRGYTSGLKSGLKSGLTSGLNVREIHRALETDASAAYRTLRRHTDQEPEPDDDLKRWFHRSKILYTGIRNQLAPARRVLFTLAICSAALSFLYTGGNAGADKLLLFMSAAGLGYLLLIELADRVRVRDELEVARQIQSDLLPSESPEIPGYSFAYSYEMAEEVGGDYHDVRALADGRVAIIIGDASGHGIAAGLLMAITNATLKTILEIDPQPGTVLRLLNKTLFRTGNRRAFVTLFYALLDPTTGEIEYGIAGHPFPLHRRATGTVRELGGGSLPLGMRADIEPLVGTLALEDGDLLLLYTDGLPEAMDADQQSSFGFERLRALVEAGGSASELHDRTRSAFDAYTDGATLTDDLTLLTVERSSAATSPSFAASNLPATPGAEETLH